MEPFEEDATIAQKKNLLTTTKILLITADRQIPGRAMFYEFDNLKKNPSKKVMQDWRKVRKDSEFNFVQGKMKIKWKYSISKNFC